jgi:hypothetical protein
VIQPENRELDILNISDNTSASMVLIKINELPILEWGPLLPAKARGENMTIYNVQNGLARSLGQAVNPPEAEISVERSYELALQNITSQRETVRILL